MIHETISRIVSIILTIVHALRIVFAKVKSMGKQNETKDTHKEDKS